MNCKLKRELMRKLRETDEGKESNRDSAEKGMSKIRETDEGKENNRNISAKIRSTDEGKEKHRLGRITL